jgi:hypothetical protein
MFADEFDEAFGIRLPVTGKALEVFEDGVHTQTGEQRHRVVGVFVEFRVEDAGVHKVGYAVDRKEDPTKIVKFELRQSIRRCTNYFLDVLGKIGPYLPWGRVEVSLGIAIACGLISILKLLLYVLRRALDAKCAASWVCL